MLNISAKSPPQPLLGGAFLWLRIVSLRLKQSVANQSSPRGDKRGLRGAVVKAMILHCKSYDIRR